jgi:hypothetical protein
LIAAFFVLWLVDYSPFDIPATIPNLGYSTYTVLMFVLIIIILIVFQKKLIKIKPATSIMELVLFSLGACMLSQIIYQVVRQFWFLRNENNNKFHDLAITLVSILFISGFLGLSIATEIKKANTAINILTSLLALGTIVLLEKYFPHIGW